jgi:hypothetical protein
MNVFVVQRESTRGPAAGFAEPYISFHMPIEGWLSTSWTVLRNALWQETWKPCGAHGQRRSVWAASRLRNLQRCGRRCASDGSSKEACTVLPRGQARPAGAYRTDSGFVHTGVPLLSEARSEDANAIAATPTHGRRSRRTAVIAIVTLTGLVIVSVLLWLHHYPPPQQNAVRLSLGLPQGITLQRNWHPFEEMALSPDGEMVAFSATDASGQSSL